MIREVLTTDQNMVTLIVMTQLSLADVKARLSEMVGRVHDHHERITITVHGKPAAVLISPYDLESMVETLEILNDPELMARLAEADEDIAAGRTVTLEEVAAEIAARRGNAA